MASRLTSRATCGAALVVAAAASLWSSSAGAVAAKSGDHAKDAEAEAGAPPPAGQDACVDEKVKADLFAKRQMRGTRERLFLQTNRHEIMLQGGYYVSDLFDGNYVFGAAYAYHMTEDLAVEASGSYSRIRAGSGAELERNFSVLGENSNRRQLMFSADLIWVPAHGKLRIGGSIDHFDLYLAGGAGVVDSVLSSDIAGNGGFGLKFFIWKAFALRLDVRDYIYRQQLLSKKVFVNDLTTMLGVSLYLPIGE